MIRYCIILCWVLMMPLSALADPTCGSRTSTAGAGSAPSNPMTLTFTPSAGTNRVQILVVHGRDSPGDNVTIDSVSSDAGGTWNTYSSGRVDSGSVDFITGVYWSTNFADGSQSFSVTTSSALLTGSLETFTCFDVDTATVWRAAAATATGTATTATVDTTGVATGDLPMDFLTAGSLDAGVAPTADGSQSVVYNTARGTDNMDTASSTKAGSTGTVTFTWTTMTGVDAWAQVAGALMSPNSFGVLRRRTP